MIGMGDVVVVEGEVYGGEVKFRNSFSIPRLAPPVVYTRTGCKGKF